MYQIEKALVCGAYQFPYCWTEALHLSPKPIPLQSKSNEIRGSKRESLNPPHGNNLFCIKVFHFTPGVNQQNNGVTLVVEYLFDKINTCLEIEFLHHIPPNLSNIFYLFPLLFIPNTHNGDPQNTEIIFHVTFYFSWLFLQFTIN